MLNLKQYRENPNSLSDLLPWAALIAPGVILNKDGSFQSTIKYRGPDLDSSTESELMIVSARINNVLSSLGSGWCLYAEAKREESNSYPLSDFPEPISFLIDEERRLSFESVGHFESSYYLTLVYLPPSDAQNKVASTFLDTTNSVNTDYNKLLEMFSSEVGRVVNLLSRVFPEAALLSDAETLTYLHSTISEKPHSITVPECPMYLDSLLVDSDLLPGFEPKLGSKHLRIVSLKGFPASSQPGLLDLLNRLSVEYRWTTRFITMDKSEAERELRRYKKRWFAKRKGVVTLLKEVVSGESSVMEDSDALNNAHDANSALEELQADEVAYGYFTTTVVLESADLEKVVGAAQEVERAINSLGFTTKLESVNATDAWLGSIPGNCRNNVRRPILNTLNLSHLIPLSCVWSGPATNSHLNAPPLFLARTNGSTQFRFSPHVGDVGHTLVLGPTGAGKSVLLNLMAAQFLRYEEAQVYIFDKGGSARTLTAGVGGDYYDLAAEDSPLSFQPLARIDQPEELRFAHEWLLDIFIQENLLVTPSIRDSLWTALKSLSSAPEKERTLFGLTILLQDDTLRKALLPYTIEGAHGAVLDQVNDKLEYSFWQCFEMEVLMETPAIVMPVLSYLFHRLEQRFKGKPTILILDEAWLFLDNPAFAAKIREWLKVLRKANVSVVFATQSLADIDESPISATIKESCFTKIYLPNSGALNQDSYAVYQKFGLNDRQIRIVSESFPKKHYYYTSPDGNRLFELALGELSLAYLAGSTKERQAQIKRLTSSCPETDFFNQAYLKEQGLDFAVEHLEAIKEVMVEAA